MIHLKTLLPKLIKSTLNKSGLAQATLILDWDKVIGQKLAFYTMPLKLSYPKNAREGGSLLLLVHPSWALLVQQSEQMLLEQINAFYGYKAVERLRLKQGYPSQPKRNPPLRQEETPKEVDIDLDTSEPLTHDPDLDKALRRLERVLIK